MKRTISVLRACGTAVFTFLQCVPIYAIFLLGGLAISFYFFPYATESFVLYSIGDGWMLEIGMLVLCILLYFRFSSKGLRERIHTVRMHFWHRFTKVIATLALSGGVVTICAAMAFLGISYLRPDMGETASETALDITEDTLLIFSRIASSMIDTFDTRTQYLSHKFSIAPINAEALRSYVFVESSHIFDAGGNELGCFAKEYRIAIPLDEALKKAPVVQAILASEDHKFFEHEGFNAYAVARAAISNKQSGKIKSGASTLTMQLVKNIYLSPEKTIKRKMTELVYATQIEKVLTKDEILHLYLNLVYFGGGYGIEAGSRGYFDKPAQKLSAAEAAFLAGLINQPNAFQTGGQRGFMIAMERQKRVLWLMYRDGALTTREYKTAINEVIAPHRFRGACATTEPFTKAEVNRELGINQRMKIAEIGAIIETTIDMRKQRKLEEACRATLTQYLSRRPYNKDTILCQSIVVEIATGEIVAMVGGQDFLKSQYNGVTQSFRQAGSSFKPFLYAAYLEKLQRDEQIRTDALCELRPAECATVRAEPFDLLEKCFVYDQSVLVPNVIGWKGRIVNRHAIGNYPYAGRPRYRGKMSCMDAIAESRNAATMWAEGQLALPYAPLEGERWMLGSRIVAEAAHRMGITSPLEHRNPNPDTNDVQKTLPNYTISLGSAEISLWEQTHAYLPFVNGGCKEDIYFIRRVSNRKGSTLSERLPFAEQPCTRVLSPDVAYGMRTLLQNVVDNPIGTAYSLRKKDMFPQGVLCGKTGTSTNSDGSSSTENWFIGCTVKYLSVTRINNVNKTPLGNKETGGRNALPVFAKFIKDLDLLDTNETFPEIPGRKYTQTDMTVESMQTMFQGNK